MDDDGLKQLSRFRGIVRAEESRLGNPDAMQAYAERCVRIWAESSSGCLSLPVLPCPAQDACSARRLMFGMSEESFSQASSDREDSLSPVARELRRRRSLPMVLAEQQELNRNGTPQPLAQGHISLPSVRCAQLSSSVGALSRRRQPGTAADKPSVHALNPDSPKLQNHCGAHLAASLDLPLDTAICMRSFPCASPLPKRRILKPIESASLRPSAAPPPISESFVSAPSVQRELMQAADLRNPLRGAAAPTSSPPIGRPRRACYVRRDGGGGASARESGEGSPNATGGL